MGYPALGCLPQITLALDKHVDVERETAEPAQACSVERPNRTMLFTAPCKFGIIDIELTPLV